LGFVAALEAAIERAARKGGGGGSGKDAEAAAAAAATAHLDAARASLARLKGEAV
jgi:hypothetical protein